jgi:hypothetical protein
VAEVPVANRVRTSTASSLAFPFEQRETSPRSHYASSRRMRLDQSVSCVALIGENGSSCQRLAASFMINRNKEATGQLASRAASQT